MSDLKPGIIVVSLVAVALAGCQSSRFGGSPAPVPAAPTNQISGSQLPPPAGPQGTGAFPEAPGQSGTDMAALDPAEQAAAAANAPALEKNSLLGSWSVASSGANCQMFLTLTKYGDSSRGGTRGCGNELANMRSWDLAGNQVMIYDEGGNTIATLYSSGEERLSGQTTMGSSVSLSR